MRTRPNVDGTAVTKQFVVAMLVFIPTLLGTGAPAGAACPDLPYNYPDGRSTAFHKPDYPIRAKDFAAFREGSVTHLFHIRTDRTNEFGPASEVDFGHVTSTDLLNWTVLANVNPDGGYPGGMPSHPAWSAKRVWAPSIVKSGTTYYMFYTGVDANSHQRIGVSTSQNLSQWTPYNGNPLLSCSSAPGAYCAPTASECRDPFVMRDVVIRDQGTEPGWLLYVTAAASVSEDAVWVFWAPYGNLFSWTAIGKIPTTQTSKSESPHLLQRNGLWYLFFSSDGPYEIAYVTGNDPAGITAGSWSTKTSLPNLLGRTLAAGYPQNWFASEAISSGGTDDFFFVHDYDPPLTCDPSCGDPGPTTIEVKRLQWAGATPGLADLPASWDETFWSEWCPASGPTQRWNSSLVHDSANDRYVLYGGETVPPNGSPSTYPNDVWTFSPATRTWSALTPAGAAPPARAYHAAIYDPVRQRMLVVGGEGPSPGDTRTVYALSLGATPTWSIVSVTGLPSAGISRPSAIYDAGRDQMLVIDPFNGVSKLVLATSTWGSVTSTPPPVGREGTAVYDATGQRLLFVGGWDVATGGSCGSPKLNSNSVSALNLNGNPAWSLLSQAPWLGRYQASAYFDALRNRLVISGGIRHTTSCTCIGPICGSVQVTNELGQNDVWTLDLATLGWAERAPQPGTKPPARGHQASAWSSSRREMLVFGGGARTMDASMLDCMFNCTPTTSYVCRKDAWTLQLDVAPATASLVGTSGCYDHIFLTWTAPGDDGMSGTATLYDLRTSSSAITEANFGLATGLSVPAPQPGGSSETFEVTGLSCQPKKYYALKTRDDAGNWSAMSNVVSLRPACPQPPIQCSDVESEGLLALSPARLEFAAPRPNPVHDAAITIRFGIPAGAAGRSCTVDVFDPVGRRVRSLYRADARPGFTELSWDLRSNQGSRVPNGVYFLKLGLGEETQTRQVLVVD